MFEDSQSQGPELETGFVSGSALVPGAEFHRQLRVLRRLIEERLANAPRSHKASGHYGQKGRAEI
jgi:hypothetical protein